METWLTPRASVAGGGGTTFPTMKVHATYGRFRIISSGVGTYHVQVKPMDIQMGWVSIETFDHLTNARKMATTLWRAWVEAPITHIP